jgi:hypothetical protein
MTPELRRRAKAINFGIIYGISGFGLARNLRIPKDQAQRFIDQYFVQLPRHQGLHGRGDPGREARRASSRPCSAARSTRPRSTPRARRGLRAPRGDQRADPGARPPTSSAAP